MHLFDEPLPGQRWLLGPSSEPAYPSDLNVVEYCFVLNRVGLGSLGGARVQGVAHDRCGVGRLELGDELVVQRLVDIDPRAGLTDRSSASL